MDNIMKLEVFFNMLNTVLAKATYLANHVSVNKLCQLRHEVYYGRDFDYDKSLNMLKEMDAELKENK